VDTRSPCITVSYRLIDRLDETTGRDAALLTADQHARSRRLLSADRRRDFVAAHGLAVWRVRPVDPADWRFEAGPMGKPAGVAWAGDRSRLAIASHGNVDTRRPIATMVAVGGESTQRQLLRTSRGGK